MKPNRTLLVACVAAAACCLPVAAPAASRVANATLNRVALNPQPLPPKALAAPTTGLTKPVVGQDRSIIIVGGKPTGAAVSLNPQPLPPKAMLRSRTAGRSDAAQRGIIIVGGKQ
jgi:hypothetical protein